MAAISTSSPLASLNPTTTDHDWRFPRRPDDDTDSGADATMKAEQSEDNAAANKSATAESFPSKTSAGSACAVPSRSAAAQRDTVKQLRFDLSDTMNAAQGTMSKAGVLPDFCDGIAGMSLSPEDQARKDPLAIQIWRLYAKTKQTLPNQERMENLTWRMMHANLRKQSHTGDESHRYACLTE